MDEVVLALNYAHPLQESKPEAKSHCEYKQLLKILLESVQSVSGVVRIPQLPFYVKE